MKPALTLKKMRFASCVARGRLLKQWQAGRAVKSPGSCVFKAVKSINKMNFTRREILEEVSPRKPIHPSIERIVSSHE
jgi:hypothetical protein